MASIEEQNSITFIGVGLLKRLFSPPPDNQHNFFLKFVATAFYRLLSIALALTLIITGIPTLILKIPYLIYININQSSEKRLNLYAPIIKKLFPKTQAEITEEKGRNMVMFDPVNAMGTSDTIDPAPPSTVSQPSEQQENNQKKSDGKILGPW